MIKKKKTAVLLATFHLASHHTSGGFGSGGRGVQWWSARGGGEVVGGTAWCGSLNGQSVCSVNFRSASGRNNSRDKLPVNGEGGEESGEEVVCGGGWGFEFISPPTVASR